MHLGWQLAFSVFAVLRAVNASCRDEDARCAGWAKINECSSNPGYMLKHCRKSCNQCKEVCANKESNKDCNGWKTSGYCGKGNRWYAFMKKYCKKSCGFCEDRDECIKNPCKNGGTCIDGLNSYQCKCADGYTGANCEQNIDECSTNPCKNGGTCIDGVNSYQCKCADGYKGANCEQAVSDCKDDYNAKDCANWAAKGECKRNSVWMHVNCRKSCKKCSTTVSDCKDNHNKKECKRWAAKGECERNPEWMHVHCKKSCSKCSASSTTKKSEASLSVTGSHESKEKDKSVTEVNGKYCGLRLKSRVVGGTDAAVGDWPWQVGIARSYNPSTPFCGGSLINKQWVVTANHCFGTAGTNTVKPKDIVILLGEHDISRKEGNEKVVKVSKIIRHEDYKLRSYDADITLVKLESPVAYNAFIKPVCLPDQDQDETIKDSCYVTGWGRTQEGGQQAKVLQEAKLPIVSRKTCSDAFGIPSTITENMICAGFKKGGIDACQGDSGGPFVCRKKGRFQLAGVVSFGRGCARANLYGVYAKVSKYVNWIKRKIKE